MSKHIIESDLTPLSYTDQVQELKSVVHKVSLLTGYPEDVINNILVVSRAVQLEELSVKLAGCNHPEIQRARIGIPLVGDLYCDSTQGFRTDLKLYRSYESRLKRAYYHSDTDLSTVVERNFRRIIEDRYENIVRDVTADEL